MDANARTRLDQVGIVLVQPQDPINVGAVLRALANMGIRDLRLVEPCASDPVAMAISGLGLEATARALPRFGSLPEATADGVRVVAFSGRSRRAHRAVWRLEELPDLLRSARDEGKVLLVFGREDSGLSNDDLDHCHGQIAIDTDPAYPHSLNLAQAVLLAAYTARGALATGAQPAPPAGERATPATAEELEQLYGHLEATLEQLDFFKFEGAKTAVMRQLRSLFARALPDQREVRTLRGILSEIARHLYTSRPSF